MGERVTVVAWRVWDRLWQTVASRWGRSQAAGVVGQVERGLEVFFCVRPERFGEGRASGRLGDMERPDISGKGGEEGGAGRGWESEDGMARLTESTVNFRREWFEEAVSSFRVTMQRGSAVTTEVERVRPRHIEGL
jgi:hypothetical protein